MTQDVTKRLEKELGYWEQELDKYSAADLKRSYDANSWTLGQVYWHVTYSGLFFFKQVNRCFDAPATKEGLTETGEALFARDSFPQVKIRMPQQYAHVPEQPSDQDAMRKALQLNLTLARSLAPKLADAPTDQRLQHPAFGWLNAGQWFQMTLMHYEHHRRQKDAIDAVLRSGDA